jgi:hypothetical protein
MSALDINDIAVVSEIDLAIAMTAIVSGGHASVLFTGPTAAARAFLDRELQAIYEVDAVILSPVLVRFWALVDAMQHRRLQTLLLQHGHAILGQFTEAASSQRLNAQWGFNPQKLLVCVTGHLPSQPARCAVAA